jgi:hypothetical protein
VLRTAPITAPSFEETAGICAIPAVVDSRRVLGRAKPLRGECTLVGTKYKNPFKLRHNNVNFISVEAKGQSYPAQPLTPSFGVDNNNNNYIKSYLSLFSETGKVHDDNGNDITRESFRKGYTLWAFDLSPDKQEGDHVHLVKEGNLRVDLKFAEALTETASVFVYAEFDNVIEIDRSRNIINDFQ